VETLVFGKLHLAEAEAAVVMAAVAAEMTDVAQVLTAAVAAVQDLHYYRQAQLV
jgi:hypothetical protein